MPRDLYAALCLVLVIEGLVLFVAPHGWRQMMQEATRLEPRTLRMVGAGAVVAGLVLLRFLR